MIQIDNLTFARGNTNLIENGRLTIQQQDKIGLIGANGCGKSSFFNVLLGNIDILAGECDIPKNFQFAHAKQELPDTNQPAIEYVIDGDTIYRELYRVLDKAIKENDHKKIAWAHQELENIDAYRIPAKAGELLNGLGFSREDQTKPVKAFSGGWRVRLNLAKALIARSDCLLLDEPTNHLDIEAMLWLEGWLKNYNGTVIIIAHDSVFLDAVVQKIVVIENQQFLTYKGNYSQFLKQRSEQLALNQKTYEKQQKKRAHLQKFIDKFKAKASKAKQAQSRVKQLERMELVQANHVKSKFEFHFPVLEKCPNPILKLDKVSVGYSTPLLSNINFLLSPGSRIGLVGENGAGKSTFIKLLAGVLAPLNGDMIVPNNLTIGYFSQHQVEQLDVNKTAIEQLSLLAPTASEQTLRDYLGGFGFNGDKAFQEIKSLSGGEKARLTLSLIIWQNPHCLLLDEPTNHLDIEMREALSLALQEYEGALVLISHDRQLINDTTETLYLVADGKVSLFKGDMEEYCKLQKDKRRESAPKKVESKINQQAQRKEKQKLQNSIDKLEREIQQALTKLETLKAQLADNALYQAENGEKLKKIQNDFTQLENDIQTKENAWIEASEKISDF